jgi:uncharacterized protein YkwD
MRVGKLLSRRLSVVVVAAVVGLGVAACQPPPPPPPPAPAAAPNATLDAVLQAMNHDRAAYGLAALGWNAQLGNLAADWSNHMAQTGQMVHRDLSVVLADPAYAGFWTLGENLLSGSGPMSAAQMEATWMNSAPHRANILSGSFNVAGIGISYGANGSLWVTVDFGGTR